MQTIEQRLQAYKGLGPGFDFLRIGLAVSIVAFHAIMMTGHYNYGMAPLWFAEHSLVPMFFALSGFLVTGSAMRLSLKNFLINRSLRILPALAVDIIVCALIIGPLMTTLPLGKYFAGADFYKYFWNVTGWIHYSLPGVFRDNPSRQINGALWTVPFEMLCYFMMSLLIVSRGVHKPLVVAAFVIFVLAVKGILYHFHIVSHVHEVMSVSNPIATLAFVFVTPGTPLLVAFLLGILVYQLQHLIPYSWPLFILCCVFCAVEAFGQDRTAITRVLSNDFILLPPFVYMTCFLGLTEIPVPKFVHSGDYSYGVYLYHSPFLQIIIALFPGLVLQRAFGVTAVFLSGLALVAVVATCSWHFVEKPILGLRKRFSFVARVRGVANQADAGVAPPLVAEPGEGLTDGEPGGIRAHRW